MILKETLEELKPTVKLLIQKAGRGIRHLVKNRVGVHFFMFTTFISFICILTDTSKRTK